MRLYYSPEAEWWVHSEWSYQIGRAAADIAAAARFSFIVREQNGRLGPFIGILTSGTEQGKLYGDFRRFAALQSALQKNGGISFVFSPHGMQADWISGYVHLPDGRWRRCRFPYPDVVYNRIPYRSHEQTAQVQQAVQTFTERGVPLFNPCFFPKWETYRAFQSNPALLPHLLPTRLFSLELLPNPCDVYIKRSDSAKGKHLFRLKQQEGILKLRAPGRTAEAISAAALQERFSRGTYLVQDTLQHDTQAGRKYDLRVAVHFFQGSFHISGIGVRLAAPDEIVTHVPNGGALLSPAALTRPVQHEVLQQLAGQCGRSLQQAFGHVREFSLDIGVDINGRYFIYEANSKPMVFDEPHISARATENLICCFLEEAGFPLLLS